MEIALGAIPFRERRKNKKFENDDALDFSKPATSGLEYLRRVQRETALCPEVVIAKELLPKLNRNKQPALVKTILTPASAEFKPSLDWQFQQASTFAELRQRLNCFKLKVPNTDSDENSKLPIMQNEDQWCRFCLGERNLKEIRKRRNGNKQREVASDLTEEEGGPDLLDEGKEPLLSILMGMGQCVITNVLEYHLSWLQILGFSERQGKWMFALLACLEKPLPPNGSSLLRNLARRCADLRASLEDKDDPRLAALNLIIALVTRFFDQTDLAEDS